MASRGQRARGEMLNYYNNTLAQIRQLDREAALRERAAAEEEEQRELARNRAIVAEFAQREKEKEERKLRKVAAAKQLGTMGGRVYRKMIRGYGPRFDPKPHVKFGAEAAHRSVKLSDIAMARMPRR